MIIDEDLSHLGAAATAPKSEATTSALPTTEDILGENLAKSFDWSMNFDTQAESTFDTLPAYDEGTLIGRDALDKLDMIVWSNERMYMFPGDNNWRDFDTQPTAIDAPPNRFDALLAPVRFEGDEHPIVPPFPLDEDEFPIPEWMFEDDQKSDDPNTVALQSEFPEVFKSSGPPTDLIEHCIKTESEKAIFAAVYRPASRFNDAIEEEINRMLEADVIEECESAWAFPIVLVKKKNGSIRFCIDYRKLNAETIPDRFPMPEIDHLLHSAKQSTCMPTLDLQSGYWQVPVKEDDRDKTAFVGPTGLYRFKRMPFGMRNAPATFQRLANKLRAKLPDVQMFAYLDDFIIISDSEEEHWDDLRRVLTLMRRHHLRLNAEKCRFFRPYVKYLGHVITREGINTDPGKVAGLLDRTRPKNKDELLSFKNAAA